MSLEKTAGAPEPAVCDRHFAAPLHAIFREYECDTGCTTLVALVTVEGIGALGVGEGGGFIALPASNDRQAFMGLRQVSIKIN